MKVTNRNGAPEALWRNWQWRSEGDLFKNGAFFRESGPEIKSTPFTEHTTIQFEPAKFVGRLTRKAGVIQCKIGKACQACYMYNVILIIIHKTYCTFHFGVYMEPNIFFLGGFFYSKRRRKRLRHLSVFSVFFRLLLSFFFLAGLLYR